MSSPDYPRLADPWLIEGWLSARSVIRGVPPPTPDSGGLRVDTDGPRETRRYVFARPDPGLRRLAETITEPRVFLKLCASADEMAPFLTDAWARQPDSYVMTYDGAGGGAPSDAPESYRLELTADGGVSHARLLAADGELAASGFAGENERVFIYDQIVTSPAHRRRGLGSVIMRALESTKREPTKLQLLVASEDGKGLYEALGWRLHAPYTTVAIPER